MPSKSLTPTSSWIAVAAAFAVSGASALVLQFVWIRWLTLGLGSSTRATTLVLATFMAGLGLGAWWAGRIGDRLGPRALRAFAVAEAIVGVWALLSVFLLGRALPEIAAALGRLLGDGPLPLPGRVLLAVAALLPPTVMMGATLPLLAAWAEASGRLPARGVGALYTVNTLGAAAGTLVGAFALVETLGLAGSAALAGLADLAVAAVAWAVATRGGLDRAHGATRVRGSGPPAAGTAAPPSGAGPRAFAAVGLAYFLTGFVGMALEIVTHRILGVLAGSSVYAFVVMLAAFLFGIAAGSALAAAFADRVGRPVAVLAVVLAGLGVGVGFVLRVADPAGWSVAGRFGGPVASFAGLAYGFELGGYFLTLLPAALLLGAAVPLVARAAGEAPGRLAGRFGSAYALNTAGAVAGTVAAGVLLVPWLGTARAMTFLAVLPGLGAIAVATMGLPRGSRALPSGIAAGLLAAGWLLCLGPNPVLDNVTHLLRTQYRGFQRIVRFDEGPVQTITVADMDDDVKLAHRRILTNRTSLTATTPYSRRYMYLLGHLPALWAEDPRRALVICFGTGMTASAVADVDRVERLDVAEISPEVVDAADLFRDANRDVLDDPRVRLFVEDGRHVLLTAAEPWDVITLEPPPPRDAGVVSLYSSDFYRLCRRRLAPGGVVAQWLPLHSHTREETRMLAASFVESFPHVLGFLPVGREMILLGAEQPLAVDPAGLAGRMATSRVRAALADVGFVEPADLLATALLDRAGLEAFVAGAPPVSDDRPSVEYFLRYGKEPAPPDVSDLIAAPLRLEALLDGPAPPGWRERFDRSRAALFSSVASVWSAQAGRGPDSRMLAVRAVEQRPDDRYYRWAAGVSEAHLERLRAEAEAAPGDPRPWVRLAVRYGIAGEPALAEGAYRRALDIDPDEPESLLRLGLTLLDRGGEGAAEGARLLRRFLEVAPGHPAAPEVAVRLTGR